MISELTGDAWAVQARFSWDGVAENPKRSFWDDRHGERLFLAHRAFDHEPTPDEVSETRFHIGVGSVLPRCHPACALVRNTPLLRGVTERIGFSCGWIVSGDPDIGGFGDTLALASEVMAAAGLHFVRSRALVGHFFNVSYDRHAAKSERCEALLRDVQSIRPPERQ